MTGHRFCAGDNYVFYDPAVNDGSRMPFRNAFELSTNSPRAEYQAFSLDHYEWKEKVYCRQSSLDDRDLGEPAMDLREGIETAAVGEVQVQEDVKDVVPEHLQGQ